MSGGLSWLIAVCLCLVEIALATIIVMQALLGVIMESVFVKTMEQLGAWNGDNSTCNLADECRWVGVQLVLAVVTLPLNFVPVAGTILFCALNGALLAWEYHGNHTSNLQLL